jgi:hypothetical protein
MTAEQTHREIMKCVTEHLAFLGYYVAPVDGDSGQYWARHAIKRGVFLRCRTQSLDLEAMEFLGTAIAARKFAVLEAVNRATKVASIVGFGLHEDSDAEWGIYMRARLPLRYEKLEFGSLFGEWETESALVNAIRTAYAAAKPVN